jgi:trk system potassium uptake protein
LVRRIDSPISRALDSLSGWAGNPITVPALFIFGGLGFIVVTELYAKRTWQGFSLHTKLMVVGTFALIVWSVLAFAGMDQPAHPWRAGL